MDLAAAGQLLPSHIQLLIAEAQEIDADTTDQAWRSRKRSPQTTGVQGPFLGPPSDRSGDDGCWRVIRTGDRVIF